MKHIIISCVLCAMAVLLPTLHANAETSKTYEADSVFARMQQEIELRVKNSPDVKAAIEARAQARQEMEAAQAAVAEAEQTLQGNTVEKARKDAEKFLKKANKELQKAQKEYDKLTRNIEKEISREKERAYDSIAFDISKQAINDMHFVIVAERIRGKYGYSVNVNETTNFILVQGDRATVQFALEGFWSGPNGMGGLTFEGSITNTEINIDKKGNLNFSMHINGPAINADVRFTLPKDSNYCEATVTSSFHNNRITFSGTLKPYKYPVHQGRTL